MEKELEKAAIDYGDNGDWELFEENNMVIRTKAFVAGAKWMQERMYSEEDVLKLFHDYKIHFDLYRNIQVLPTMFSEWFEQFKKK